MTSLIFGLKLMCPGFKLHRTVCEADEDSSVRSEVEARHEASEDVGSVGRTKLTSTA